MDKLEDDWNGWQSQYLKTYSPYNYSFSNFILLFVMFDITLWEIYLFATKL